MDTTTQIIQRRIKHWKTSLAGISAIVCPLVALFVSPDLAIKLLGIGVALNAAGNMSAADAKPKMIVSSSGTIDRLPSWLLAASLATLMAGCSTFSSFQSEIAPDGTVRETKLRAHTFFDGRSDLSKLRASTTDKTQGMTIGGLGMESSGTNATFLIEAVVGAAVKAAIKP